MELGTPTLPLPTGHSEHWFAHLEHGPEDRGHLRLKDSAGPFKTPPQALDSWVHSRSSVLLTTGPSLVLSRASVSLSEKWGDSGLAGRVVVSFLCGDVGMAMVPARASAFH